MANTARLRRSGDIAAVRAEGRSVREPAFLARIRPNGLAVTRVAVSAPRTVGSAVARNRARRRVREAFRLAVAASAGAPALDVVVSARREALSADAEALRASAAAALRSASGQT